MPSNISNQEIARLAAGDHDLALQRVTEGIEKLQRSDRKGRSSATSSPKTPPFRTSRRDPYTTPTRRRQTSDPSAKVGSRATASPPDPLASTNSQLPLSTTNLSPRKSRPRTEANSSQLSASIAPDQTTQSPALQAAPSGMSSQRRGAPRNGPRGGSDDNAVNRAEIADEIRKAVNAIADGERKAKSLKEKILLLEQRMRKRKDEGLGVPISEHNELEALYREQVKIAEEQKVRATDESLLTRITLLGDVQKTFEQEEGLQSARNSSSRTSGIDFDGPSDSPVPSPADNRHVRKIGGSRTSSQPPRSNTDKLDGTAAEVSERASKPKIMYSLKEEVAFKRKLPSSKPEDQDWIQGEVVRVIGEGKSRRYDVKDIDPDAVGGNNIYKSSASQMVPIPPEGTPLGDYEPGKQVLALYPAATTFYRAQVKSMVDGGARVLVLFEEEDVEKSIARRFVLDHKG
ncbi:hypothetical protein ACEPPN_009340 [Leptodophora sp. 'Broadleaf-Isolate-01']